MKLRIRRNFYTNNRISRELYLVFEAFGIIPVARDYRDKAEQLNYLGV